MKNLFLYRLRLIQFSFLIFISPLLVKDWALWSKLFAFKQDYIACTIALLTTTPFRLSRSQLSTLPDLTISDGHTSLFDVMTPNIFISYFQRLRSLQLYYFSQFITPQGTHMITWNVYLSNLSSKKGYRFSSDATSSNIDLVPTFGSSRKSMKWIIVHWTSDCVTRPNDVITLSHCPGCSKHVLVIHTKSNPTDVTPLCITPKLSPLRFLLLPTMQERIRHDTTVITSPFTWADLNETVRSYYGRLDIQPNFSQVDVVTPPSPSLLPSENEAASLAFAASLLATPPDNHYCFYTDGSLINLGTPEISMGWSWVQVLDGASFFQSIAAYAHGVINTWPSSTRAEIAAIHAALTVTPPFLMVTIHTDSQSTIDGFRLCATSSYSNNFVIDWDLTWFSLNFEPQHDASFTHAHAFSHRTFKFKLFLEDLPTLEHLKRICTDLYIDILSCRSCLDSKEDFMYLFMCKCRRIAMEQILLSYQKHFINKLQEAGDLVHKDPSLIINKFKSLPCWFFSSSNWASYSLIRGCLPKSFVDFFEEFSVPRNSAMKAGDQDSFSVMRFFPF
ncbi:hypothetical protein RhiirC2_795680 [Rhizophagus irregularis]|uniref:RNase H type-1 domain-containing protein n=1 Tax=Rhizophagus irregularis TaxID=588596 RepID=A0A2N1MB29_9GLOM|nr:hypothetical protein RhiirC2_795680 [Rhizophagus irregularis]